MDLASLSFSIDRHTEVGEYRTSANLFGCETKHQTKKAPPEYSDGATLITLPRAAADRWKTTRSSRSG